MSLAKIALIAVAFGVGSAVAAHAQSATPEVGSGNLVMIGSGGELKTMQLARSGMETAMKYARRLPRGTMIVQSGNSFYVLPDRRMRNGQMMSELFLDRAKGYTQ